MTTSGSPRTPASPLLSADDEARLARQIEAGVLAAALLAGSCRPWPGGATAQELDLLAAEGERARRLFVAANLRLVAMVAGQFASRAGSGRAELFQEGCVGLLIAVQRFDHRRGCRFATYALFWIRATIGAASARSRGAADLPTSRAEELRALRGLEGELAQHLGRTATTAELASAAGKTETWVAGMVGYQPPRSLDDLDGVDLVDPAGPDPAEIIGRRDRPGRELLSHLTTLERRVLERRMGFVGGRPHSDPEGARALGVTIANVRRSEARGLDRLRAVCPQEAATQL
jgi:RNA polymerase primary sigma factor/RNA polymerase nonessential primary-like sigma factor